MISTVLFAVVVALTGSLVLFLGSAAGAAGPSHRVVAAKAHGPRQLSELIASDAWTGDDFGWSVAVSGSTAVVGAPYAGAYKGAAYIFSKTGKTWTQTQTLSASDAAPGNEFGWSVAISGTTVAVGSPGTYFGIGTAYVFTDTGGTWTQQSEFSATDAMGGDKFGYSVVTSGSSVMVGADGHSARKGAVYIYTENAGSWPLQVELTASDGLPSDMFGWSMAVSGSTLVVSAVRHAANGAIYVFTDTGGTWSQVAELKAGDGADDDYFGDKVAVSGRLIVAGAPGHNKTTGAAYIFRGAGANWTEVGEPTASDGAANNCFGWSVGLSGTTVLVGAEQHNAAAGAAYVFKKSGSTWKQQPDLTAGDAAAGNEFGYSASLSGNTAVIGADNAEGGAGSAYIFKV
ncbi:MAG TPA: FG-GAP repeat protein [Acidimicrobiales bacterium]|nr:FG-GAP repeat protein [Acidimicrobiales bacterium]